MTLFYNTVYYCTYFYVIIKIKKLTVYPLFFTHYYLLFVNFIETTKTKQNTDNVIQQNVWLATKNMSKERHVFYTKFSTKLVLMNCVLHILRLKDDVLSWIHMVYVQVSFYVGFFFSYEILYQQNNLFLKYFFLLYGQFCTLKSMGRETT